MAMELRYGTPEEVGMSAERVQRVVELAEGWVAQGMMSALVVFVARRGVIVAHEAFGHLAPEPDSPPLELDTIFPLASLSKPITATLAMILVEDGLLGLNRPVQWYIPEFVGEDKDKVMVHHLLTHTSGLEDDDLVAYFEKEMGAVGMPPPDDTQHPHINKLLSLIYDKPLWKPPGTEMQYCGYGFELTGEIVRRVSGMSVDDFARKRIFQPLGMKDTNFIVPDSMVERTVKRPENLQHTIFDSRYFQKLPLAHGGVYSTTMDTAIFGQMFLNRGTYGDARVLSPASVAAMTRNQIPGISARFGDEFFPEASWGLGWDIHGNKKSGGSIYPREAFGHGGIGGVFFWMDPIYKIVGVYFSVMLADWNADLLMNAVMAGAVD